MIWVNLDPKVTAEIEKQLSSEQESPILPPAAAAVSRPTIMARVKRHQPPGDSIPASSVGLVSHGLRTTVYVPLTGGNIRNSHIHLSSVIQFFPEDAIGGRNKTEVATKTIRVTFSPGSTIDTDIDGTKKLLRARGAITDFFARSGAMEGDMVRIYRTAPYEFDFSINLPT